MKRLKKYLSCIMALALVFSLSFSVTAFAEEAAATEGNTTVTDVAANTDVTTPTDVPADTTAVPAKPTTTQKAAYTVLILDESGSMRGTPIEKQKEAGKVLVEKLLDGNSGNQIALVSLNTKSVKKLDFTNDASALNTKIDGTKANGGTNINQALEVAAELLDGVTADVQKNIVLCSDGIPESGTWQADGKYTYADHPYYCNYGNACFSTAETIKAKDYTIFTVGMFHTLSGTDFTFGKQLMEDLASPEKNGNGKLAFITDDMDKLVETIIPAIAIEILPEPEPDPVNPTPEAIDMTPRIILDQTSVTLLVDENTGERQSVQLQAQVFPSNYPNQEIEWYTDRDQVAEVEADGPNSAVIIAVDEGDTVIHANLKGEDDVQGECKVSVSLVSDELAGDGTGDGIPGWYEVTDFDEYDEGGVVVDNTTIENISMSSQELKLTAGKAKKLPLVIEPSTVDEGDINFVYTSSDDTVVEVENGNVEGLKPGTAVVTVALKDDVNKRYVSASIQVTVAPKPTAYTKVVGGNKQLGMKWKILKTSDYVDGYQIQYSTNKNMSGAKSLNITSRKTSAKTIKNLKNGKTYYTRIRAYHNEGNLKMFSSWSKVKSAKVKASK